MANLVNRAMAEAQSGSDVASALKGVITGTHDGSANSRDSADGLKKIAL